jgi:putative transposase
MPQSLASVLVHLIYSTKNREPLITPDIEPELFKYQSAVFKDMKSPAILINGTVDHVHALFRLGRTVALCDVVEEVKKSSSRWIKSKGSAFVDFQWQAGYGAFSLGESGLPAAIRYVEKQKEHHRRKSFQDEFREFLRKYKIEFDERYVWE